MYIASIYSQVYLTYIPVGPENMVYCKYIFLGIFNVHSCRALEYGILQVYIATVEVHPDSVTWNVPGIC